VIPNEKLLAVAKDAGFFESFRIADDVLRQGVQGISDIITIPGIINRDFADVKTTMAGMGHAVMGTAVRAGENRAIEAAQAAMASPLLEAGAIDGARGILINITGSSSLKLSEVNAASSLIQTSAHEDANIIFGAVLDEKMGDDVKITVIATGFRDQMPERRARMLTVEEAPVVSVPLASVPLVAPNTWMPEPAPAPEPEQPRFLSQDEDGEEERMEADEEPFFTSFEPVATSVFAASRASIAVQPVASAGRFDAEDYEPVSQLVRPQFAELAEDPAYTPLPRDYAPDFGNSMHTGLAVDEKPAQTASALFDEADEAAQKDLDYPAFLRKFKY